MKILACIVTYNRKELLIRNIKSLMIQDSPLDILVLDNASTDQTEDYLKQNGYFNDSNHYYYCSKVNSGGSGGFNQACKWCVDHDYDYAWLMDDDGYCMNTSTLSALLKHIGEKPIILNSLVLKNEQTLTFSINGLNTVADINQLADHSVIQNAANPFNGTLVPVSILKQAGLPKYEFFIYGDETEFIQRIQRAGFRADTVTDSLYFHPVNNPEVTTKTVLNQRFDIIDYAPWKLYCFVRNYCYIYLTYHSRKEAEKFVLSMKFRQHLLHTNERRNQRIIGIAKKDAFQNDFSRNILDIIKNGDIL